jgi:Protein of unknown function (DUF1194)
MCFFMMVLPAQLPARLCRIIGGKASRLAFALCLMILPAEAGERVSLELVLAVDVSLSVNDIEYRLQMNGVAAAFRDPEIARMIREHQNGVAVLITQWSGTRKAVIPLPWAILRNEADASGYAAMVESAPRPAISNFTALGQAISFAVEQLERNALIGDERTIDVSGDGHSNTGPSPAETREQASSRHITVNGLTIVNNEAGLTAYYERNVIAGPDSFVISAQDFTDFAAAFNRKLRRELNPKIARRSAPFDVAWSQR